jgi:hypothetical protein
MNDTVTSILGAVFLGALAGAFNEVGRNEKNTKQNMDE